METKIVSLTDGDNTRRLTIGEETAIIRLRRSRLKLEAVSTKDEDVDSNILRVVFYPDCVAAVVDWGDFQKPSFEEFSSMPGKFVDQWATAVWELNPDWSPNYNPAIDEDEDEKKQLNSTSD